jgi:transcriptional regulator with XRE-family HTH domain
MLKELREQYGLSRPQLAELTGRSPNYLLKAESLTFPKAPVALVDFYCRPTNQIIPDWEPQDKFILESAYRDAQRTRREEWLDDWIPRPAPTKFFSFRRKWLARYEEEDEICPTEYRVSQGLCIPAAAVYRAEKTGWINDSLRTALSDLSDYVLSGRYTSKHGYQDSFDVVAGVLRIRDEIDE